MRRTVRALILVLVGGVLLVEAAAAQGGVGGNDKEGGPDNEVESSAEEEWDETATNGPGRDNAFVATTSADITATVGAPAEPPCLEWRVRVVPGPDGSTRTELYCAEFLVCGYERVDDALSGTFSGGGSGRFAQFLSELGTAAPPIAGTAPGADPADIFDQVLAAGLGDQPDDEAMPTMAWCARESTDELIIIDDDFGVSFSWDITDIWQNYPITEVRRSLIDEVRARIRFYEPDVGMVPPLEDGRTWVKFPTWLWVNDPLTAVRRYAVNDRETIRVEMRARLDEISFDFDDRNLTCTLDDMVAYAPDRHDPIEDRPPCSIVFDDLDEHGFDASLTYTIEERIAYAPTGDFPDEPWTAHPTTPSLTVTNDLGTLIVTEVQSLVTVGDQ